MTTLADINQTLAAQNESQDKTTKAIESLAKRFGAFIRLTKGDNLEKLEERREARRNRAGTAVMSGAKRIGASIKENIGPISKILGALAVGAFILQNDEIRALVIDLIDKLGAGLVSVFEDPKFQEVLGAIFTNAGNIFGAALGAIWEAEGGKAFIAGITLAVAGVFAAPAVIAAVAGLFAKAALGGGGAPIGGPGGAKTAGGRFVRGLGAVGRRFGLLGAVLGGGAIAGTLLNNDLTADEKAVNISGTGGGMAGALGGAAAGAMAGSVVPVVGTTIGGLIGGTLGYFAGEGLGKGVAEMAVGEDGFIQGFKQKASQFESFLQSRAETPAPSTSFEGAAPLPFGLDKIDLPSINLDKALGLGQYSEAFSQGVAPSTVTQVPNIKKGMDASGFGEPTVVPVPVPSGGGGGGGGSTPSGGPQTIGGNLKSGTTEHLNQNPATVIGGSPRQQSSNGGGGW